MDKNMVLTELRVLDHRHQKDPSDKHLIAVGKLVMSHVGMFIEALRRMD